eukprot:jgi/Psemu1/326824/estExt_fgenesh1_pg.C_4770007
MVTIRLYSGRDSDETVRKLEDAVENKKHVSSVEIRKTVLEEEVIEAIVNLVSNGSVETVHLDDCGAHLNRSAVRIAEAIGKCKYVRLYESTFLSKFFLENLLVSATNLKSLRIQDYLLSEQVEALSKGLRSNDTLLTLDLSRSRIDNFSALAEGMRGACMRRLNLRSIGLQSHHATILLSSLESCPALESLDLSFNHIRDVSSIGKFLRCPDCNLRELMIGYQNLWQGHRIDASEIAGALTINEGLKTLELPRNELDDSSATEFAAALASNSALETLDLRENNLSDAGVSALAASARASKGLRRLQLGDNAFGTIGLLALLDAASHNYNLVHLDDDNNNIVEGINCDKNENENEDENEDDDKYIRRQIHYHTTLNRDGRKLLLEEPPLGLWPRVMERCSRLDGNRSAKTNARTLGIGIGIEDTSLGADSLYYLLKANPALIARRANRE